MKTCLIILCIIAVNLASLSVKLAHTDFVLQTSKAHAATLQSAQSLMEQPLSKDSGITSGKSRIMASFLAIFPGLHQFYLGNYIAGIIYLALSPVLGIGAIISLIDGVMLWRMSDDAFHRDVIAGETYWSFRFLKNLFLGK